MWLAFDPKVDCVFSSRKSNESVKLFAYNVKISAENPVANAGYLMEEYV